MPERTGIEGLVMFLLFRTAEQGKRSRIMLVRENQYAHSIPWSCVVLSAKRGL